uniref:Basal-body rod modification protein FlgD n=1 Tax=Fundidesulfovibrio putealis TaxID=270496 RepID=A0A7C4EJ38_9BACT
MTVDTVSYLNSIASSSSSSTASSSMGKDDFLQILVAQLESQDPFNTVDESEMISQLTQFSSLEQLTNMNDTLTSMVQMLNVQSAMGAVDYIGKSVMASGYTLSKSGSSVSDVSYTLDSDVSALTAKIYDADGTLVRSVDMGAQSAGDHTFEWDGLDADGASVEDGQYSIAFAATDSSGNEVGVSTMISGTVTGVSVESGAVMLTLADGRQVALSDVHSVTNPDA